MNSKRILTMVVALLLSYHFAIAQCNAPTISNFSPNTGFIGSIVTITGSNFDAVPANNQVFFGATKANVLTASFGQLTVQVPVGATYAPITVKNGCGLIGQSALSFNGIFCGTTVTANTYNTVSYSMNVSGGYQMISQDMDLDGKPDLLVCGFTTNKVSICRNLSTPGIFNFAPKYDLAFSGATRCIAPGDFDGDGIIDIAVVDNGINGFRVFRNLSTPGNLNFGGSVVYSSPSAYQIATGDLNGDGKLDLVTTNGGQLRTFINTSTGAGVITFVANTIINNTYSATGIAIADIDGDGKFDVGTSCGPNNVVTVNRNTTTSGSGTFSFAPVQSFNTNSAYPYRLFVGDFDKDGKIDLTTNNHSGGTTSIFRNTSSVGSISFNTPVNLPSPGSNYRIGVGDADGDGRPDIVTKSSGVNTFSVYVNISTGPGNIAFLPRTDYPGQAEVSGVVIADLDGDYVPDISTSGTSYQTLRVHRNNSAIIDTTPPVANCKNITVALDPTGNAVITPQMVDNGSSDACGIDNLALNITSFNCSNVGPNTVVLTVTDRAGNTATCTAIVTVAPAAIIATGQTTVCQGQTVTLNANTGDSYQWLLNGNPIPGATNQSYIATVSGNYQVTVTNAGGCNGTSDATVVTVNNNPTVTVTPNGTVLLCPPSNSAILSASTSAIYQWILNGTSIPNATQQTYNATTPGVYQVQVVDLFGCSALSDSIHVTNSLPEIDIKGNGISIANGDNTPDAADNTNFGTTYPSTLVSKSFTIENNGANSLTINSITIGGVDAANFNISGISLPIVIAASSNATFNVNFSGTALQLYNASVAVSNNDCDESSYTYAISAEISCSVPAFTACPSNIIVAANSNCNNTVSYNTTVTGLPLPAVSYVFSGSTTGTGDGNGSGSTFNIGTTQVTVSATNPCGTTTCTFTVTVNDSTPPTIVCPPSVTVNASATDCGNIVTYALPQVNDNCSGGASVNPVINGSFENGYTGWTCGSSNSVCGTFFIGAAGQTYTYGQLVYDYANNINENIYSPALPFTATPSDGNNMAVFMQRCSSTHLLYQDITLPSGNLNLSLDFGYRNHNTGGFSNSQFVAIELRNPATNAILTTLFKTNTGDPQVRTFSNINFDVSAYAGQNVRLQIIDASIQNYYLDVFIDNVKITGGSSLVQTAGLPSGSLFPLGTTVNTFVATDSYGNTSTCSFNVTVYDSVAPVAVCKNATVSLDANGLASVTVNDINNGSSDNCGIASVSSDKQNFDCSNVGNNTVTLTVTDVNGNVSTCAATVTVVDDTAPTAVCKNATASLDANGLASITVNDINNGSSDNCGIASISVDKQNFDCSNVGNNTVTLTVTDVNGNVSTCTATVTVVDDTAPTAVCKNATVSLDANGQASITVNDINNGSSDNCGIATVSIDKQNFDCSNVGNNTVTLTVTDVNGNVSTCTATVTVVDTIAPTLTGCPSDISVIASSNNCSPSISWTEPSISDNCTFTVSQSHVSGSNFNVGTTTVTYLITDASGNTVSCSFNVTVTPEPLTTSSSTSVYAGGYNISCNGNNDGYINITVAGGCLPYTYNWSHNSSLNSPNASNLTAGGYTVVITDANGSSVTLTFTLTEPALLVADAGPNQMVYYGYNPSSCATLNGSATGGTSPYSYSWSNGQLTASITVCPTATTVYTLYVTDANGCISSNEVKVCVTNVKCSKGGKAIVYYEGGKVLVCHIPSDDYSKRVTLCIAPEAVPDHLAHGDYLGICDSIQPCTDEKTTEGENNSSIFDNDHANLVSYPNPFETTTTIRFNTVDGGLIELSVYNLMGEKVATIYKGSVLPMEIREEQFNADNLPNGIYMVRLVSENGEMKTIKINLSK